MIARALAAMLATAVLVPGAAAERRIERSVEPSVERLSDPGIPGRGSVERSSGARGTDTGLAVRASKIVATPRAGRQVIDGAVMLVRDGRIEAVGARSDLEIPDQYEVLDVGEAWVTPGMVDLHCHVASTNFLVNDLNDMLFLTNPGLRASTSVVPGNRSLALGAAAGVTAVLYIPGSGSEHRAARGCSSRPGCPSYEDACWCATRARSRWRSAGNPERWAIGVGRRPSMNWTALRNTCSSAAWPTRSRWEAFDPRRGPESPERDIQWDLFRDLLWPRSTQVSTHTQMYQVVLDDDRDDPRASSGSTCTSTTARFGGYLAGAHRGRRRGVPAILGPARRSTGRHAGIEYRPGMFIQNSTPTARSSGQCAPKLPGARASRSIGFNTDARRSSRRRSCFLQAGTSGALRASTSSNMAEHVRGLTIVPAVTVAGIDRPGREPRAGQGGRRAWSSVGDPADPRSTIGRERLHRGTSAVYYGQRERDPRMVLMAASLARSRPAPPARRCRPGPGRAVCAVARDGRGRGTEVNAGAEVGGPGLVRCAPRRP